MKNSLFILMCLFSLSISAQNHAAILYYPEYIEISQEEYPAVFDNILYYYEASDILSCLFLIECVLLTYNLEVPFEDYHILELMMLDFLDYMDNNYVEEDIYKERSYAIWENRDTQIKIVGE